jgi:HAMP domain-containing protein
MASAKNEKSGLLGRLMMGVFIPTVVAFLIVGGLLFTDLNFGKFHFTSIRGLGLKSIDNLGDSMLKESTASLNRLGERLVVQKTEDVARQIEIYLKTHPARSTTALVNDLEFRAIVLQKFGETGYTSLANNAGVMLIHPSPAAVGKDVHQSQAKDTTRITDDAVAKGAASGYYKWKEANGKISNKFMALKVIPGRDFHVGAMTYMDEFSRPAAAISAKTASMEKDLLDLYNGRFLIFAMVVGAVLALLLVTIYFFSSSVVKPIRQLSEIADRISMGDLKAVVTVKGKGEVRALAESIERMQVSVRAAIERLQRRREGASSAEARPR